MGIAFENMRVTINRGFSVVNGGISFLQDGDRVFENLSRKQ